MNTSAGRLRQIAGPDLYRRNPFRVAGLLTDARAAQVRARRHLLLGALELGSSSVPGDQWLPLPEPPSAQDVRAAFDSLERPDHRLVDELFWWWGEPGACGCAREVHEVHDIAIGAHAKALDVVTDEDLWADAADGWMDALDHPGFWDHVRHRMTALADRRMDESTVDGLRKALPQALLAPQAKLAAAHPVLAKLMDSWDLSSTLIEDARRSAAEPTMARMDALITDVVALLDAGSTHTAVRKAEELAPLAVQLDVLAPHDRYSWSARQRNRTAVVLNNCGLALETVDRGKSQALLRKALTFAVEDRDRDTITRNLATPVQDWRNPVIQQVRAGNKGEAVRLLRQARSNASGEQIEEIDQMLEIVDGDTRRLANITLSLVFVAAVVLLFSGLLGTPIWVSAVASALFSWAPVEIINAQWWRHLISGTTSMLMGIFALVITLNVIARNPWEVLEPFAWSLGAYFLASFVAYGAWLERRGL